MQKRNFRIISAAIQEVEEVSKFDRKWSSKKHSKSFQIGALGRPLIDILRFRYVGEKLELLMNFGAGNILYKIEKS